MSPPAGLFSHGLRQGRSARAVSPPPSPLLPCRRRPIAGGARKRKGASSMGTIAELRESAEEIGPGVVADRRYLHQHPELGFQEENTARFVAERLRGLGIEPRTGVAKTGVVGLLRGGQPGKT